VVRKVVSAQSKKQPAVKVQITTGNLSDFLGVRKYTFGIAEKENQIGQVNGLAWTEVGGDLLNVEVAVVPGKGNTKFTGKLGDVMQESVSAALSVVRRRAQRLGIQPNFYEMNDLHVHFPEGAIPKDGPSAGIAICTALVSALSNTAVRADIAMTGEITLRGEVLAIGGLKEKLLAALRGGIKKVLIPHENVKDLSEMPPEVLNSLEIVPVRWIDEVLQHALESMPQPIADTAAPIASSAPTTQRPKETALKH
jgi:ATP-dependent Lon protease